jgi:hypothetical protein
MAIHAQIRRGNAGVFALIRTEMAIPAIYGEFSGV